MDLPTHPVLQQLQEAEALGLLDIQFAGLMGKLAGGGSEDLLLASALTSRLTRAGHVCLDLARAEEMTFPEGRPDACPPFPTTREWVDALGEACVVGSPGEYTPLVLDERARLYLHRYWSYQETIVQWIRERAEQVEPLPSPEKLPQALERAFPEGGDAGEVDWQKVAACTAALRRFTVISGGPGTGKTTTVTGLLAVLLALQNEAGPNLRIALAAPTGKAAARLGETVQRTARTLLGKTADASGIPLEAATLHRLLGSIRGSPYFRHHADHRLPLDVLVVDEASMVDLALMAKLVQALPDHARLILLGDRDQLASVEAGAVLGDICGGARASGFSPAFRSLLEQETGERVPETGDTGVEAPVRDGIVLLRTSHRFKESSGLGRIARLVNEGDEEGATALLREKSADDVHWSPLPAPSDLAPSLHMRVREFFEHPLKASDPMQALKGFERFRILCALREGPYGVKAVNRLVERSLAAEGVIHPQGPWYAGRPVLVNRNDYELQLFNGDLGMVLLQEGQSGFRVCFPTADGTFRSVHPMRLPEHETAFAMTVHKSQGSEFDHILLILPDRPFPVLTRELLYTAVTRARRSVEIWTPPAVFKSAVSRRTRRSSGLQDALWKTS